MLSISCENQNFVLLLSFSLPVTLIQNLLLARSASASHKKLPHALQIQILIPSCSASLFVQLCLSILEALLLLPARLISPAPPLLLQTSHAPPSTLPIPHHFTLYLQPLRQIPIIRDGITPRLTFVADHGRHLAEFGDHPLRKFLD